MESVELIAILTLGGGESSRPLAFEVAFGIKLKRNGLTLYLGIHLFDCKGTDLPSPSLRFLVSSRAAARILITLASSTYMVTCLGGSGEVFLWWMRQCLRQNSGAWARETLHYASFRVNFFAYMHHQRNPPTVQNNKHER